MAAWRHFHPVSGFVCISEIEEKRNVFSPNLFSFLLLSIQSVKIAAAVHRFLSGFNPLIRRSPVAVFNFSQNSRNCSAFRPFLFAKNMERRSSNNSSGNSPLRMSPSSSVAGLINGERKKPFLIGVAGGTASGKVILNFKNLKTFDIKDAELIWSSKWIRCTFWDTFYSLFITTKVHKVKQFKQEKLNI